MTTATLIVAVTALIIAAASAIRHRRVARNIRALYQAGRQTHRELTEHTRQRSHASPTPTPGVDWGPTKNL